MALQNLDFSGFKDTSKRGYDLAKTSHWLNDFTGGALKGADMGMKLKSAQMKVQDHKSAMVQRERAGRLTELQIEGAEQDIEIKRPQVDRATDMAKLKLEEQQARTKAAKKALDQNIKKISEEGRATTSDYLHMRNAIHATREAYLGASGDPEQQKKIVKHYLNVRENYPEVSALTYESLGESPEEIDKSLSSMLESFDTHLSSSKQGITAPNDRGGLDGLDAKGNWGEIKTPAQVRKETWSPQVSTDESEIDNWRKPAGAWYERFLKNNKIAIDLGDMDQKELHKRIAARYLGIVTENKDKDIPTDNVEEIWEQALHAELPPEKLVQVGSEDGITRYKYDPNAKIKKETLYKDGKPYNVEVVGLEGDKVRVRYKMPNGKMATGLMTKEQFEAAKAK